MIYIGLCSTGNIYLYLFEQNKTVLCMLYIVLFILFLPLDKTFFTEVPANNKGQ